MARISSITFDKNEQVKRATILTKLGPIKVEWMEVAGNLCWFSAGKTDARKLAIPVIQKIERLFL